MPNKPITSVFYAAAKNALLFNDDAGLTKLKQSESESAEARPRYSRTSFLQAWPFRMRAGMMGMVLRHRSREKIGSLLSSALNSWGFKLRYNARAASAEICIQGTWQDMKDRTEDDIRAKIGELFHYQTDRGPRPLHYGGESWRMFLNAILNNCEVDPFLEWFEGLEAWDGTERLDCYLNDLFEVETTPIVRWVAQFPFVGTIQRAYNPGAKLDEMPVLTGAQGIGKSALLRSILPSEYRDDWFADGLHLASDPKTRAEALQGRVIVEASEMAGSNRAELESLKAFITRQDDGAVRLSYRRNPEKMQRRCVIIGTSNRTDSLPNDPTGNRRFVPIDLPTSTGAVEPYMDKNRVQLWAEALKRYLDGVRARLPRDLMPDAAAAAEGHRNRDELLEDRIDALTIEWPIPLVRIAEEVGLIESAEHGVKLNTRDTRRLTSALKNAGWELERTKTGRFWSRVG